MNDETKKTGRTRPSGQWLVCSTCQRRVRVSAWREVPVAGRYGVRYWRNEERPVALVMAPGDGWPQIMCGRCAASRQRVRWQALYRGRQLLMKL